MRRWLCTVATRTCLDAVRGRDRRALPVDLGPSSQRVVTADRPSTDVDWLGPYPSSGLRDAMSAGERLEQRESVELAFVAALQHLPGNQRAALILFEVLSYSAAEIAAVMDTSVASVNSALQRARAVVASKVPPRSQQQTLRLIEDDHLREVVAGYASALERGDVDSLVALFTQDVTWSMPPLPHWYAGLVDVTAFAATVPLGSCGSWHHRVVEANAQRAVASYLRPQENGPYDAWAINILTLRDGLISEVTSFIGVEHFATFGLPASLD
ncbi:RNA polymerase subunit sigma-70 [Solicola sp. PLA-1-18]|uniref:RNA polymerase subunit sigma-70 n=1 Tax=Solicola sp. PLA-1-18 TaxID=3380532 RepID=UPI003B7CED0A